MFSRKITSHTVEINAPQEWVWDILADIDHYSEWNPFTTKVEGKLELHKPLDLHVKMPKRGNRVQREVVAQIRPPHQLAWGMTFGVPFLLTALRKQTLLSRSPSSCSYNTSDAFKGLLSNIVYRLFYDDVFSGFNHVAYALKAHAETSWLEHIKKDQT